MEVYVRLHWLLLTAFNFRYLIRISIERIFYKNKGRRWKKKVNLAKEEKKEIENNVVGYHYSFVQEFSFCPTAEIVWK